MQENRYCIYLFSLMKSI